MIASIIGDGLTDIIDGVGRWYGAGTNAIDSDLGFYLMIFGEKGSGGERGVGLLGCILIDRWAFRFNIHVI